MRINSIPKGYPGQSLIPNLDFPVNVGIPESQNRSGCVISLYWGIVNKNQQITNVFPPNYKLSITQKYRFPIPWLRRFPGSLQYWVSRFPGCPWIRFQVYSILEELSTWLRVEVRTQGDSFLLSGCHEKKIKIFP